MAPENDFADRLPPHNQEAEQSVLGSMLKNNLVINDVTLIVHKEDFYTDAHQKIFETMVALNDKGGQPVDLIILHEALKQRQYLEDAGGSPYLAELWDAVPSSANVEYYAHIVREKALLRNLIRAGNEILGDAYKQVMPADEMVAAAERAILEVAQKGVTGSLHTLDEAIAETYDRIDKRTSGSELAFSGLSTGFADLNEITAGLQRSELIIIAARPSVGKTAFSLSLTRNIIVEEKQPVFFVSLEQSRLELAERMLCAQARVDSHRLRKGTLTGEDMEKLIDAGGILRAAGKLIIDDTPSQGMLRIAANARRLKRQHDIKLIVIDYLQLIEPDNRRDPRQEQVAQISRRLKFLARELEIPVIALAQVNRSSEDRQDHRPRLSDLRESGCLTGDTLITMAKSGERVPIRELAGRSGFDVWALDEVTMKLVPAKVTNAFCTGRKTVFRMRTRLGRVIRATANHEFRAFDGWKRLDELRVGDHLAITGKVPSLELAMVGVAGVERSENPGGLPLASLHPTREALSGVFDPGHTFQDSEDYWDQIASIEPDGEEEVFDLTVPGPQNFVANDIIVHNSIEQDADTVLMLHRPDRYEPGQHEGVIEIIIAKQRNGPTGEVTLAYIKQHMRYEDFKVGTPFDG